MASTTKNALDNDDGVGVALVLAIEGYDYLLTDHDDLDAVTTAWAATDWSKALPGLIADAEREEEISPWSAEIGTATRTFKIQNMDVHTDSVAAVPAAETIVAWENLVLTTDNGGGELEKTSAGSGWSAGGTSVATITGDGYCTWTVGAETTHIICGLSVGNTDAGFTDIDFGIYTRNDSVFFVYENGNLKASPAGGYTASTVFKVERSGTTIKYYRDIGSGFVLQYTSLASSTGDLIVDCSMHTIVGAKIQDTVTYSADDLVAAVPGSIDSDRFGKVTHADGAGNETYLTSTLDPDDATSITCTDNGDFATSGDIFIGPECISYSSVPTAQNFNGSINRGKYNPFAADTAANWGRYHVLPTVDGTNVQTKLIISDAPRTWIGKQVELRIHRVTGGVLDTYANGYRLFAGTIGAISDTANMETVLSCDDIRSTIKKTVLLRDQFKGRVKEGVHLTAGTTFGAGSVETTTDNANDLVVKASGASGANEINAGYHTVDELAAAVNEWLAAETVATRLHSNPWTFSIEPNTDGGWRTRLFVDSSTSGLYVLRTASGILTFFGFDKGTVGYSTISINGAGGEVFSGNEPMRYWAGVQQESTLDLEYSTGTWFNNRDWLPGELIDGAPSGENWGLLMLGENQPLLAQYSSDTRFVEVKALKDWSHLVGGNNLAEFSVRYSDNGDMSVKQIAILHGSLEDVMLRLLASTGASGYNHATYDDWPHHLGAAIPWDLLGTGMTNSLSALAEATSRNALSIVLEKPTSLEKAIGAELLLRGAFLVWKNEGLQFVQLPTPNSDTATHTLTESNKASPAGASDANRTVTETTDKWLRNAVTVKFNRDIITGEYRDTVTIRHESSISRYGVRKVEIKARNAYGIWAGGLNIIESLIVDLGAYMLPMFAEPFKIMHRTIDLSKYLSMYVGDIANVTDNYARDPATGVRGIAGKPALVLSTSYDLGGYKGQGEPDGMAGKVTLGFTPLDNTFVWAPAALLDDTATGNGYEADTPSAGKSTITCYANKYSLNGETKDAARFAVGDELNVIQVDQTGLGTPDEYTATVESVDGNTKFVFDQNLAGFDTSAFHRVTYANYSSCQSTQLSKAFQADTDDGQIQDSRAPMAFGAESSAAGQAVDLTILPMRYALSAVREVGDGDALNTGFAYDLAAAANNLINYKTAPSAPYLFQSAIGGPSSATAYELIASIPFDIGQSLFGGGGLIRKIYVAPLARGQAGLPPGTGTVRVTVTPTMPRVDDLTDVAFIGKQQSATFAISSSAYSIPTAIGLPVVSGAEGVQWIHLELVGDGSGSVECHGLVTCYLGPLEAS